MDTNDIVRAASSTIEEWKKNHDEAEKVKDLEELIGIISKLVEAVTLALNSVSEKFFHNESRIPGYEKRKQMSRRAEDDLIPQLDYILSDVQNCEDQGYEVIGAGDFKIVVESLKRSVVKFRKTCPEPNRDMLARTKQNILLGQISTVKEILHEDDRAR